MPSSWTVRASGGPLAIDFDEVRRALEILVDPDYWVEIRGLPSGKSKIVHGSDMDGLCRAAEELSDNRNLYYGLNPVLSGETHGTNGAAIREDIAKRRWLLLDIDPVKDDVDMSATESEKESARVLSEAVLEHLSTYGWAAPVIVDSGNGWHLLYRVDLPNTTNSQALMRAALYKLAERFDTSQAKIDRSVHNASRIAKLPGTFARKGESSKQRPFRRARLHFVPREVLIVSEEEIKRLVDEQEPAKQAESQWKVHATNGDASAYARKALDYECARVKQAPAGGRNNALNRAAFSMGQLVAGGCILQQEVESELHFAAVGNNLEDDEIPKTIRSGLEAGKKQPRTPPEKKQAEAQRESAEWEVLLDDVIVATNVDAKFAEDAAKKPKRRFELFTLTGLMTREFPEPNWVIPGIMSEGINILAGKPKMGKSMLALNLAITVAAGGMALKQIRTTPGDVLYLSLEDKHRRIKARAGMMVNGLGCHASSRLKVATTWPRQDDGGLKMLDVWFKLATNPALVIIDVWTKFRPAIKQGNLYEQDYKHMSEVKDFIEKRNCSALIVQHTRKMAAEDMIEEVSGSQGNTGAADGIIVLVRSRGSDEAKVVITGRDVSATELALEFHKDTLTWESHGDAGKRQDGKNKTAILDVFRRSPGSTFFSSEVAEITGLDKGICRTTLFRMERAGELKKIGHKYGWPVGDMVAAGGLDNDF